MSEMISAFNGLPYAVATSPQQPPGEQSPGFSGETSFAGILQGGVRNARGDPPKQNRDGACDQQASATPLAEGGKNSPASRRGDASSRESDGSGPREATPANAPDTSQSPPDATGDRDSENAERDDSLPAQSGSSEDEGRTRDRVASADPQAASGAIAVPSVQPGATPTADDPAETADIARGVVAPSSPAAVAKAAQTEPVGGSRAPEAAAEAATSDGAEPLARQDMGATGAESAPVQRGPEQTRGAESLADIAQINRARADGARRQRVEGGSEASTKAEPPEVVPKIGAAPAAGGHQSGLPRPGPEVSVANVASAAQTERADAGEDLTAEDVGQGLQLDAGDERSRPAASARHGAGAPLTPGAAGVSWLAQAQASGRGPGALSPDGGQTGLAPLAVDAAAGPSNAGVHTASGDTIAGMPSHMTLSLHGESWPDELGGRVVWMLGRNASAAELKLDPPELGQMKIRIEMEGDATKIHFSVQSPVARDAVQAALPRLRDLFHEAGINLQNVGVTEHGGGAHQGGSESGFAQERGGRSASQAPTPIGIASPVARQGADAAERMIDAYA